jgi:uncharacterized membrane protein YgcG
MHEHIVPTGAGTDEPRPTLIRVLPTLPILAVTGNTWVRAAKTLHVGELIDIVVFLENTGTVPIGAVEGTMTEERSANSGGSSGGGGGNSGSNAVVTGGGGGGFSWDSAVIDKALPLAVGARVRLPIRVRASADCTGAKFSFRYSSVDGDAYYRQLEVAFPITVVAGLDVVGFHVWAAQDPSRVQLCFEIYNAGTRPFVLSSAVSPDAAFRDPFAAESAAEFSAAAVAVAAAENRSGTTSASTATATSMMAPPTPVTGMMGTDPGNAVLVEASGIRRVVVDIPRVALDASQLPPPDPRTQYVVPAEGLTAEQLRETRVRQVYALAIARHVNLMWRSGSFATGRIGLDGLAVTAQDVERLAPARVELLVHAASAAQESADTAERRSDPVAFVADAVPLECGVASAFAVSLRAVNRGDAPIRAVVRCQPVLDTQTCSASASALSALSASASAATGWSSGSSGSSSPHAAPSSSLSGATSRSGAPGSDPTDMTHRLAWTGSLETTPRHVAPGEPWDSTFSFFAISPGTYRILFEVEERPAGRIHYSSATVRVR